MVENIFEELPGKYQASVVSDNLVYYFTLGEVKRTVKLTSDSCVVEEGKTSDNADCVCKTSPEFFLKIWDEGYRPGLKDFMSGTIKSNNPDKLKLFLAAFGKE